ncbi:TraB/GumN family protein [Ekhidna sp.]|uniref:TraB/GumN family protein n=1 Tax=Ekhidna sp. TaxID=2608089 RepID=UPI003296C5C5
MENNNTQKEWSRRVLLIIGIWIGTSIISEARGQKLESTLLWKVEGDSIVTSYIFGTFHLLPQADFEMKEKVEQAFDASEQIVMELDMDNPAMQSELMQNAFMKDGQTLDKLLSEEDYQTLDVYMKETTGIGLVQVNRFKPFFVSAMLIPSLMEGTPASYEMTFVQRAMSREKEIFGLETATEQAGMFDNIPYETQAEELMKVVTEKKEMADLFEQMIKTYKKENIDRMYELILENMSDKNQEKFLLIDRNINWLPKIATFSMQKSTFYAVGAGHLGGDFGMIRLLKEAGYKVTPILN